MKRETVADRGTQDQQMRKLNLLALAENLPGWTLQTEEVTT